MKFLLLFMFVAVALATQEPKMPEDYELALSLANAFRIDRMDSLECVHKSNVKLEDMIHMQDVIVESDNTEALDMKSVRRASCAMVCCAQKLGIMIGGEVQLKELFKFMDGTGMPEEIEKPLRNALSICKQQVTETSDECMAGFKFFKCGYTRSAMLMQRK